MPIHTPEFSYLYNKKRKSTPELSIKSKKDFYTAISYTTYIVLYCFAFIGMLGVASGIIGGISIIMAGLGFMTAGTSWFAGLSLGIYLTVAAISLMISPIVIKNNLSGFIKKCQLALFKFWPHSDYLCTYKGKKGFYLNRLKNFTFDKEKDITHLNLTIDKLKAQLHSPKEERASIHNQNEIKNELDSLNKEVEKTLALISNAFNFFKQDLPMMGKQHKEEHQHLHQSINNLYTQYTKFQEEISNLTTLYGSIAKRPFKKEAAKPRDKQTDKIGKNGSKGLLNGCSLFKEKWQANRSTSPSPLNENLTVLGNGVSADINDNYHYNNLAY